MYRLLGGNGIVITIADEGLNFCLSGYLLTFLICLG